MQNNRAGTELEEDSKPKYDLEKIIGDRQAAIVGERYRGASLANIKLDGHDQKICDFLTGRKNFLIYCGNAGIGKTYFCSALLEFVLKKYSTVRYWHEADLLKRVRSSMNDERGDYLETLRWLIDDEFVMIDDIGSTGLTDWRKEIVFEAINMRYNSMKPTVLTSNFSIKEFKNFFHERVASRLFAKENYIVEILNGEDLRQS